MKTLLHFIFLLFFATPMSAQQVPLIKVGDVDLRFARLSVDVSIIDTIATTTFDTQFYNPTAEVLEGEFIFLLGENQSVNRFALDVMGKLLEAVVVEKEQGRIPFETVVRRRVDPALLEK